MDKSPSEIQNVITEIQNVRAEIQNVITEIQNVITENEQSLMFISFALEMAAGTLKNT